MMTIPDRLPDPLALSGAVSKVPPGRGQTSFVRVMRQLGQAPANFASGSAASGAQVFNAHGFFQPSAIDSTHPAAGPDATPGPNSPGAVAASGTGYASPIAPSVDTVLKAATRSAADPQPARVSVLAVVTNKRAVAPDGPATSAAPVPGPRFAAAGSGSVVAAPRTATSRSDHPADPPRTSTTFELTAREAARGLDISVRIDGADRGRRSKLRDAIAGLLSRHGFLPGQIRINGASDAPSRQKGS